MSTQTPAKSKGQIAAEKIKAEYDGEYLNIKKVAQIIDSVIDSASQHKPDEDGQCEVCGMDLRHCEPVKVSTQPVQGLEQNKKGPDHSEPPSPRLTPTNA